MDATFDRPLRQLTESQETSLFATAIESPDSFSFDLTAEAAGEPRLMGRLKTVPEISGSKCRFSVLYLTFSASASEPYIGSAESPFSDAEADAVAIIGHTPWCDLSAMHDAAGDEASR